MELKGSKTEQNLMTAFAGESQARNKYTYFASVAKKEGYEQIAAVNSCVEHTLGRLDVYINDGNISLNHRHALFFYLVCDIIT